MFIQHAIIDYGNRIDITEADESKIAFTQEDDSGNKSDVIVLGVDELNELVQLAKFLNWEVS